MSEQARDLSGARKTIHEPLEPSVSEGIKRERRYLLVAESAHKHLHSTALENGQPWTIKDEQSAREFFVDAAKYSHPKLFSNFPEHILITSIMAGKIAEQLSIPELNSLEARVLGLFHDVGSLIDPSVYFRKDLIGQRLMEREGIRKEETQKLPSIAAILGLNKDPIKTLRDESLTRRILGVADNLGRLFHGKLMTRKQWRKYASSQGERYKQNAGQWISVKRGLEALGKGKQEFAIHLIEKEIAWLREKGINFDILDQEVLKDFNKPENQKWLFDFRSAQQTLDRRIDLELGRPPIKNILFDVGNVLITAKDDVLMQRLAVHFNCGLKKIENFFQKYNTQAMAGKMPEEEYLKLFYRMARKRMPQSLEDARKPFEHPDLYEPIRGMQELLQELLMNPDIAIRFQSDITPSLKAVAFGKLQEFYHLNPGVLYASCDIKSAKREEKSPIYMWAKNIFGNCDPQEILVVDDNEQYTDNASSIYSFRRHNFNGDSKKFRHELVSAEILPFQILL